jgi:hypothetical protein
MVAAILEGYCSGSFLALLATSQSWKVSDSSLSHLAVVVSGSSLALLLLALHLLGGSRVLLRLCAGGVLSVPALLLLPQPFQRFFRCSLLRRRRRRSRRRCRLLSLAALCILFRCPTVCFASGAIVVFLLLRRLCCVQLFASCLCTLRWPTGVLS